MWLKSNGLKLAPAIIMMFLLFISGLVVGLFQSFGIGVADLQDGGSLTAYRVVWSSSDFWISLQYSLRIVIISTCISGLIGLILSLFLYRLQLTSRILSFRYWKGIIHIPFLVPHVISAYLITLFFLESGWWSRVLYHFGWIDHMNDFPILIHDSFGWGIIMTYVWKEVPFVVMMTIPVIYRFERQWREVASILGANLNRYLLHVILPLLIPPVSAACFIVFAFMISAFEVPAILGATYPKFISVYGLEFYQNINWIDRQVGIIVYLMISVISMITGILGYMIMRKFWKRYQNSW